MVMSDLMLVSRSPRADMADIGMVHTSLGYDLCKTVPVYLLLWEVSLVALALLAELAEIRFRNTRSSSQRGCS